MHEMSKEDNMHEMSKPTFWGKILNLSSAEFVLREVVVNPCPAEPGYNLPLQTV